ncbi:hypothetical protein [Flavobacterium defluvii]|uniref:Outer membrane protein beta-barrel domain-containing protein n=1 Tax=Flavobacterium defluvii TaxID=370979 RepID=A0A1M5N0X6_9FLAO|nr:hypothetical protein [Flavobacterium defluvii]SHG83198.1 hypothetical protein SAMN05443663_10455 [Flavobacterium defluvii]
MKKQKIEDIFSSMEDFTSVPPPELWGQIEEKLDKPKKKKRAILWWSAAACLLLGLLLPSVLHFTSNDLGVKTIQNGSVENNVVLDQKNNETDKTRSIENNENILEKESNNNRVSSSEKTINQSQNNSLNQNSETAKKQSDSPKKTNNINFESGLNGQKNSEVAEKTFVPTQENGLNAVSKNQISTNKKENTNRAVAEKTFVSAGENGFNAASKNQILTNKKENLNKAVAEKPFAPNKSNSFNYGSKNQSTDLEKRNADKILAEKKFAPAKTNKFNAASANQLPNSIFEDLKSSKNKNAMAFNASNSTAKRNSNTLSPSKENIEKTTAEKSIASVQKDYSKNNAAITNANILSKKDSVQLAELQNLEKGIAAASVEEKKKKEDKLLSKADKWALQVFAGVANSENYKNNKTLGNVNDSKQSNSYGVKTQYKINKKWAVASGLKINELGQSVANVSYLNAKKQALFSSSDYFVKNETVPQIASDTRYVLVSNSTKDVLQSENVETGNLDQNLRYIEMPLEVSYSIFSKKRTNINLNTGGFVGRLISNSIAIDGNSMGENVNANDYVYGTTLSSTVQYRVYKKTNVFVEPAVNYYANPLNNQSFNQFQWGLNFGLNVNF